MSVRQTHATHTFGASSEPHQLWDQLSPQFQQAGFHATNPNITLIPEFMGPLSLAPDN